MDRPAPARPRVRRLFVRGLALVHLAALGSLWWQLEALVGSQGILPVAPWLEAVGEYHGASAVWRVPTLAWLWPDTAGLHALCGLGVGAALALLLGVAWEGPLLAILAVVYLSLSVVGREFLSFQWDTLLVESTVAGLVVARWHPSDRPAPPWAWWILWWLAFRLMFGAGFVKLWSGDEAWASVAALDVHFETQPLPNPLSWWAHHLPRSLLRVGVVLTFVVELVLPWLIVAGRAGRAALFVGATGLMAALALTGNYGFFQPLTVVLCLTVLDDGHLAAVFGGPVVARPPWRPVPWGRAAGAGLLLGLSLLRVPLHVVPYDRLPTWWQSAVAAIAPFRIVNQYGLFAVMTTERPEVVLEASQDGRRWRELSLRAKPGPLDRVPPQVAPHMPRVDWQLWFAALGRCERQPWLWSLMARIREGSPAITPLFVPGTFDDGPPRHVRAVRYRYRFTEPGAEGIWTRERLGLYCPPQGPGG